ncbi:CPBP family intramembrane glutamic endopeptidase [Evansella clarkii]|uniref:CPBP family intramembrane glutamic endopeptidase n=1 Tax=Evansella clarkii TaxID=79879 RepID=UPI001C4540C5|nr:CPBP family intramembrane glutamic endopeptidase [Evansella clarkii]
MIIKIVVLALMVNYMSFFKDFFEPITINTYGLLNELLFVNLILLGLFLLFFRMLSNEKVIRLIEKSGLFNFKNFVGGMLFFISIVITIHVSVYLINLATDYQLITVFREFSLTEIMGEYLSQIFGVALLEELFYRFIVIIYLHQLFTSRTKLNRKTITAYTLIISQVLFSVIHLLPVLLLHGMPDLFILLFQLLQYIIVGFYLFYAFYKTNNLWMAIFLHALINTNITLYYIDRTFLIDYSTLVILFSSLILLPFYHSKTKETV